jgi:hypothetical protein
MLFAGISFYVCFVKEAFFEAQFLMIIKNGQLTNLLNT